MLFSPVLISVRYKFLKGFFASESQLNYPKMCKNQKICQSSSPFQYSSPVVQSTDYTLPLKISDLQNWLTDDFLMASDKHNSIPTGLISLTLRHPKTCLFANHSSYNACFIVLPKLTFVLLGAPFPYLRTWRFMVCTIWLQYKIWYVRC